MLALRPPMGWNSWNTSGPDVNEQIIRDAADKIVELGLKELGYEYVVIDDCWSLKDRDADGRLVPDPEKFPSGMKALADYIHSKGLKFGIYSCAGVRTCARYPGSFDYEFIDAQTFADWEIDFLKYDYCNKPYTANGPILYNRMGMALRATGREILFSACSWGADETEKWARSTGAHMYRSTGDVFDSYNSFMGQSRTQFDKFMYSAPGCYNDLDMLICGMHANGNVGYEGCTDTEYRLHFAMWCFFQSPLMIGADLSRIDETNLKLLKNKELIRLDQDEEGRPPIIVQGGDLPIFFKHLSNGEYAIMMLNLCEDANSRVRDSFIELYDIGITAQSGYGIEVTDVFTGENLGFFKNFFMASVPSHDCRIFRFRVRKSDT